MFMFFFFFQAEDGIRDYKVTGVQTCALPILHQDTGKPAQGVPVTVLDASGNAAGFWVSDADGTVAIPRRDTPRLRLRVGLRNEEPIELATATLGEGPTPLAAPTQLPPAAAAGGERQALPATPPPPTPAEQTEVPGHVLYFQRLAMFAERAPAPPGPRDAVADFFTPPADGPAAMRYRSEEHTSELQSPCNLVCRLLLEKKK